MSAHRAQGPSHCERHGAAVTSHRRDNRAAFAVAVMGAAALIAGVLFSIGGVFRILSAAALLGGVVWQAVCIRRAPGLREATLSCARCRMVRYAASLIAEPDR